VLKVCSAVLRYSSRPLAFGGTVLQYGQQNRTITEIQYESKSLMNARPQAMTLWLRLFSTPLVHSYAEILSTLLGSS
jgi:hypothetical protein